MQDDSEWSAGIKTWIRQFVTVCDTPLTEAVATRFPIFREVNGDGSPSPNAIGDRRGCWRSQDWPR